MDKSGGLMDHPRTQRAQFGVGLGLETSGIEKATPLGILYILAYRFVSWMHLDIFGILLVYV